jgi:hypothetical protein
MAALVGIVMGSDSDLPTMRGAAEICTRFGVEHELRIVSAHRARHHRGGRRRGAPAGHARRPHAAAGDRRARAY